MSQQPPAPPPPAGPPRSPARRPGWAAVVVAAVLGLVVGAGAALGVAALSTSDDPADLACEALGDTDAEDVFDGGLEDDAIYRVTAAGELLLAADGGDVEGRDGELGNRLRAGVQRLDEELLAAAIEDVRARC